MIGDRKARGYEEGKTTEGKTTSENGPEDY